MLVFSEQFDVPGQRVWRLITDTRTWPLWGPTVRRVDYNKHHIHAGATGRILVPLGVWLPFRVKAFEPPHYWDWQVGGLSATGHRITPTGPNRCILAFTVPIWAMGYGLVCRIALQRIKRLIT